METNINLIVLKIHMQEILFTNIMTMSMKTAEQARVDNLRYSSIEIISQIKSKKGLYIISGLRGVGKTTILSTLFLSMVLICWIYCIILRLWAILLFL